MNKNTQKKCCMSKVFNCLSFYLLLSAGTMGAQSINCFDSLVSNKILETKKISTNNKFVILDFWYSACTPCLSSFVMNRKTISKLNTREILFISISIDASIEEMEKILKKYKLRWPNLNDKNRKIASCFEIDGYPTVILLNKNNDEIKRSYSLYETLNDSHIVHLSHNNSSIRLRKKDVARSTNK